MPIAASEMPSGSGRSTVACPVRIDGAPPKVNTAPPALGAVAIRSSTARVSPQAAPFLSAEAMFRSRNW